MTTKERFIHNLHQARTAHIRWVNSIKLLVSGIDVNEKQITLDATVSEFGIWYYQEAMLFSLGTSRMVLEEIEVLFLALHDRYMKIYPIYFGNKKKTLFSGLLGTKNKTTEYEIEYSHRHYEEIVLLSDKLKHKLRIFESQLMSLGEDKFDILVGFAKSATIEETSELTISEPSKKEENAYFYGTRGR